MVTGGSSGIGAATVRALAADGASVVVGYKTGKDRALRLIDEIGGKGHTAVPVALEESQSVRDFAARVKEIYGRTDILVNSAGFTMPVPHANVEALTDEIFDRMLIANVRGPFSVIRAFTPMLKASGDGVVVSMSSVSGFTGSGSSVAYCACKAALDTMTMSLGRALGPEVRLLCVSPGAVETDFVAGRDQRRAGEDRRFNAVEEGHSAGRCRPRDHGLHHRPEDQHRCQNRHRRRPFSRLIALAASFIRTIHNRGEDRDEAT